LTSGLPYDVFAYNNGGVLALEFLAWTNGTTRATALVRQDGVWCKTGVLTRRYVGTFYTTSTTATEDSLLKRFLFNADNRARRKLSVTADSVGDWTYTTAAWRSANNSTANRIQCVIGLSEDLVIATVSQRVTNGGIVGVANGIGVDSTSANNAGQVGGTATGNYPFVTACYTGWPGVGFHYLQWLEYSTAAGTTTWNGDNGGIVAGKLVGDMMA
jgi:hypothetical protein